MSVLLFWTLMIAVLTCVACALCGVLLVVKREAFFSEALSHAVLPGIVLAFILFRDRTSPWLIISAGVSGLLLVWFVDLLTKMKSIRRDTAMAIAFSGMFSVGLIATSLNLKNVHFHAHCIIDGNLALSAIDGCYLSGRYVGPRAFIAMLVCLVVLISFVCIFYKELKLMAFDEVGSKLLGFRPKILHLAWLGLVSIIAVTAFEAAGTILVVALMIVPAATANILTQRLSSIFWLSAAFGAIAAVTGVLVGDYIEISATAPIASMAGFLFLAAAFFAPRNGIVATWFRQRTQQEKILSEIAAEQAKESVVDN